MNAGAEFARGMFSGDQWAAASVVSRRLFLQFRTKSLQPV